MNKIFFFSLAAENIRKNKEVYRPYLLAGSVCVGLIYTLNSISAQISSGAVRWAAYLSASINFCSWFCGLLVLLILFYLNSFVMKRRKKELGLYSILGMEKRHIAGILFWEVFLSGISSIICGMAGGILFSQFMFQILLWITHLSEPFSVFVSLSAAFDTTAFFGVAFLILFLYDMVALVKSDPIALLRSQNTGEREPKTRRLLTFLGVLILALGYGMVLWVRGPSDALLVFFPAVVLVIIATFLLFTAGSIALLKFLRQNKNFYYQPENFISVSGLVYRMKQNAAGLAAICILSTCVLVTLSTTICLNLGEEDAVRQRYPYEAHLVFSVTPQTDFSQIGEVEKLASESGLQTENVQEVLSAVLYSQRNELEIPVDTVPVSCFQRICGKTVSLSSGEILLYSNGDESWEDSWTVAGKPYVIQRLDSIPEIFKTGLETDESVLIVMPDEEWIQAVKNSEKNRMDYNLYFDLSGDESAKMSFLEDIRETAESSWDGFRFLESREESRQSFYMLNGSLLFIGIFFVILFLLATVLIIYYKQITEGYDDRGRFQIMAKVGLSRAETRLVIRQQVLLMFFLPLGGAVIHIAVAFHVLCKMMTLFQLDNVPLFLACTAAAVMLFGLFYFTVYQITTKVYTRIVQG